MGSTLSVIVASVGVLDLIYCLAYVSNQVTAGEGEAPTEDGSTNTTTKQQQQPDTGGLEQYREGVRQQIERAQPSAAGGVTYAQDGVPYRDGYRVEHHDELRLDALMAKLRDLERSSQEKDAQLDQMTVQVGELERSSLEQSHIIEELRSRPLSRAASVEPGASSTKAASNVASLRGDLLSVDGVPAIVLNEPTDSGEARPSSSKFRPIRRESELRRSVKRRSVASNASTQEESRLEELEMLSRMEAEEAARVDDDDYTAIEYTRTDYLAAGGDTLNRRHNISPIHELCHLHDGDEADDDDGEREWVPERSPEPTLAGNITKPWGDIRLDEMKKKEKDAVLRLSRSMSIEEEEGVRASDPDEAPGRMIPVVAEEIERSVALPTSRSPTTHSSTPDRSEPTLRRTTKEANLPGLLQLDTATATATAMASPSDSKASSSWATEIIIHTETESDSDSGANHGRRRHTQFMQSKSPSPYAVDHHNHPPDISSIAISNQLVPLLLSSSSSSEPYPPRPRSPTPYDGPDGSSRESTPSLLALPNGYPTSSRDSSVSPVAQLSQVSSASVPSIVVSSPISGGGRSTAAAVADPASITTSTTASEGGEVVKLVLKICYLEF